MTLPLLTQERQRMNGDRYLGVIASVRHDIEYGPWWETGMEFSAATRPPFQWAGQTTTEGER